VTAALLCLAAGLLAWPDPAAARRARIAGPGRPRSVWWSPDRLGPVPAAAVAAAAGAAVSTPLVAALGAGCAALAARAWRSRRAATREEARLRGLTAALGALAADLRAGRPLEAAAASAARGTGDDELGRDLLGAVRTTSSSSAARAGPEADALQRLAAAVRLSARTGASLADVVSAVEDDLRARQGHRLELHSAVAAPRASALLLAGLPVLGLAMGSGVGADPWHVLTLTGTGQVLLVAGVALEVAGVGWSNRLVARVTRSGAAAAVP
jgi:tight adherence protein B